MTTMKHPRSLAPVVVAAMLAWGCSSAAGDPTWQWGSGGTAAAGAAGMAGSSGMAGAGGGDAGGTGGQAATGGNAGMSGTGGATLDPRVSILVPADGATVINPVTFTLEAFDVQSVQLIADGQYPIAMTWDPTQTPTHTFATTLTTLGSRTITLRGQAGPGLPEASHTIQIVVSPPPLCDGFDTKPLLPPSSCDGPSGNTTTQIPANDLYATSWFGCYRKSDGTIYEDPYDNCEFACGSMGYCSSGQSGPSCEADLMWFAADADRYGCGGHIRATNCENGRSVVLVTLDRGPNCGAVEQSCDAPVLDMSRPAMDYLFEGGTFGGCDHKRVVVEEVPDGTPLGPT